jgi:glycogen operon protein
MTSKNADMLRFVQHMIALRKRHPSIMRRRFLTGGIIAGQHKADITWHGSEIDKPLWNDSEARILAFTLAGMESKEADLHIVMNMSDKNTTIQLPVIKGKKWCVSVDTSQQSPHDIISPYDQKSLGKNIYSVNSKTVAVFENIGFWTL